MERKSRLTLFVILLSAVYLGSSLAAPPPPRAKPYIGKALVPAYLRCECRVDPLGIEEPAPRLSWIVESGQRGQRQTACRLLVASSEKLLSKDQGDLWDTGKIASDETIGTPYQGRPLVSHQRCFWKVKVWDKDGRESPWSKAAMWSMGLLQPGDWQAEWIGYDKPHQPILRQPPLATAKWIWHAADEPGNVPKCRRLFYYTFTLPEDVKVKQAEVCASADDGMQFAVNAHLRLTTEARNDSWREARKAQVAAELKPGRNELRVLVENAEPGAAGLIASLKITLEDGRIIEHTTSDSWKATNTTGEDWLTRPLDVSSWPAVRVLGDYGAQPWGKLEFAGTFLPPATYFRKEFRIDKPVARATLYATALGLVDMHLNGRRVSDDYFTPGWTDYSKRVYYRTYDVTKQLHHGDNALGAVLADGWFSGYIGFRGDRDLYGKYPRLRAQLHLEYADGSTADVATGPGWKADTGPVLEADFLKGETYDARLEWPGWNESGYDDIHWHTVAVGSDEVHPLVQAHPGPPVVAIQEFTARAITEPKPGVFVLDLGQNFAGVPRLKVSGKPGQKITLRFAERLNPDGTIYTVNLRSARATDTYICKGKGTEIWQPRFTFHGFQYIEVTGLGSKPSRDAVIGVALSSDTPVVCAFTCSDPMLNQLHNNIYWTQRANFIDIPTDCPQRDERMGWTGDAQVYIRTATLNTDVEAFFTKWLVDLDDGQRADGQYPCVAPCVVAGNDGGPAWADAGVICPWTIYEVYGDRRVLERHYDAMKRFIEFCRQRSTPDLLPPNNYHCFGDWLSINADTPKDVIYTAFFAHCARLAGRAAAVLGKASEAEAFERMFITIRDAFCRAYVTADGRIKGDTQTCYALALAFDLVQGEQAKLAANYLVEDIEKRGWHLSTGFIGTKHLLLVLTQIGRPDVAYRLLHNDTFPSWGFSIKQGATSIWERWDGWTPEKGFQDPGMNSFAHYSFGAVYQWMVENIGGIRSAAPSYKEIRITPQPDDKLRSAAVAYRGIRGLIATDWREKDGKLLFDVTIPANTTAQVALPAQSAADITESGHSVA
ncbi:MAG: family 78 glycoside hydrolase catalytic domain [Limisphaerales bacterium]